MEERDEENVINESVNKSEITFDNLVILREFSNIVNHVSNEELLEIVPKVSKKRVKWVPIFNCLKQGILDEMIEGMNSTWTAQNLPQKLDILQKQQGKYSHIDSTTSLWRPELGDVKSQLKAHDVANLQKQKTELESLAKDYETRVSRLKEILSAKRGYVKALQMHVDKYQKKNENIISKISEKFENNEELSDIIIPTKPDIKVEFENNEELSDIIIPTKPDIKVEFENNEELSDIIIPTKPDIKVEFENNEELSDIIIPTKPDIKVEFDEKIENA